MSDDLLPLPCPFCNSSNVAINEFFNHDPDINCLGVKIVCVSCGGSSGSYDLVELFSAGRNRAIGAWNNRAVRAMKSEKLRADFERWADSIAGLSTELNTPDNDDATYRNMKTQTAWEAYCEGYCNAV